MQYTKSLTANFPANLILLDMHDFDIILGMDRLAGHHATMECFSKVITFKLDAAPMEVKFQGELKSPQAKINFSFEGFQIVKKCLSGICSVYHGG